MLVSNFWRLTQHFGDLFQNHMQTLFTYNSRFDWVSIILMYRVCEKFHFFKSLLILWSTIVFGIPWWYSMNLYYSWWSMTDMQFFTLRTELILLKKSNTAHKRSTAHPSHFNQLYKKKQYFNTFIAIFIQSRILV